MDKIIKEIDILINSLDFSALWPEFRKFKFALYDEKNYYMDGYVGEIDERFMGNSAIKLGNEAIAIWNMSMSAEYKSDEKITSGIVHEMFHCFQGQYGEKRHANEILGIDYPIELENINLRSLERKLLYNSAIEVNKTQKLELLKEFFNVRAEREKILSEFIEYEKAIETFEGNAVFVEFQALKQMSQDKDSMLVEFLNGFTDISPSNLAIRRSSYFQGMVLCMIADDLIPEWKIEFQNSDLYLSDFILNKLNIVIVPAKKEYLISEDVINCIAEWEENIDKEFNNFNSSDNIEKLENVSFAGFDPMNILKRGNEYLHKHFLKINQDGVDNMIKGPVKVVCGENMFYVKWIEFVKKTTASK
ncbi:MAG: hypothetical protein JXR69_11750 [Candidatus Delongbacteria bacterium]|nr:hypothetical protein [Candidatus Delongbacteria bacterium]